MNKIFRPSLVLASFAFTSLLLSLPAQAQSVYGSIFGTVTDKTGAAVPGATVTVTDEAKGTVVTETTNASGDYSVPHLIPDVYDLKVTLKGFKTFETKGIALLADAAPRIDPTLDVGGGSETVEVNADQEPELKTDRADVATVFDQQQVSSLPVGDQNFANLQLLLPGAQILGFSHASDENPQASKQIQVDGQAFGGVAYELDGADNEDPILGIIVVNPSIDSVTETKISTQNYDAELGKAVAAVMTAQTKSGSNSFHGDVYDFRTGNANLARDPYNQAPGTIPPGLKSRIGVSVGGPIKKDKIFFFGNYEGQRQNIGNTAVNTLPTNLVTQSALGLNTTSAAQLQAGYKGADFSQYLTQFGASGTIYNNTGTTISPGACPGTTGAPGQPFPCNVIPAASLSAPSLNLLKLLQPFTSNINYTPGVGSQGGLDSNYDGSGSGTFNTDQWTVRGDYTLNQKAHAFARFSRFTATEIGQVMFGTAGGPGFGIGNYGGQSIGANDSDAAGMDIAISPKLLTDFRLGYFRYNIADEKHDNGVEEATALGIPGINIGGSITSGSPGFFVQNVPGGTGGTESQPVFGDGLGVNRCNCPLIQREDQFQIVNNWTKIAGNHELKMGADLRYGRNLRVPSDSDRDGVIDFDNGPTSNGSGIGGLGFATLLLGDVSGDNGSSNGTAFARFVSTNTNAKEFQKRTFLYAQDTWRATHKLTLNLGVRWDMYFPETVNAVQNGSLLNILDGYLHVAGVGGVPSDMGWNVKPLKQFSPRLGVTYQYDPKTVIRAGYGRSFDTGVFGSIFGHTVTQNIPVLADQSLTAPNAVTPAFQLSVGPTPNVMPAVPNTGLLPNPGYNVESKARPNPLHLTTVDAWNLAVERAVTPTLSLTVSYVGNKGTHTLADGDGNSTNPNEATVNLPAQFSQNGQALTYNSTVAPGQIVNNQTSTSKFLTRYYGGSLPACRDANYISLANLQALDGDTNLTPGMCGWTSAIQYNGDDQNTEFDALQVVLAKHMSRGLAMTANYQWASAFDETSDYYTWSHLITHMRDSNVRDQQLTAYGSYDLPFGKGKQYAPGVNHATDLIIGGWQLSSVVNWSGGLPFTATYSETGVNIPNGPGDPSVIQGEHMRTHLSAFQPNSGGVGTRTYFAQQIPCATVGCSSGASGNITDPADVAAGTGVFVNPGMDNFGNAGQNTYRGPRFFGTDMAITKSFGIWENVEGKFRMDAFNVFNHIVAANPGTDIESTGTVTAGGQGYDQSQDFGPRQLEFSLRVQF